AQGSDAVEINLSLSMIEALQPELEQLLQVFRKSVVELRVHAVLDRIGPQIGHRPSFCDFVHAELAQTGVVQNHDVDNALLEAAIVFGNRQRHRYGAERAGNVGGDVARRHHAFARKVFQRPDWLSAGKQLLRRCDRRAGKEYALGLVVLLKILAVKLHYRVRADGRAIEEE